MAEELENQTQEVDTNQMYLDEIKELKKNSVSRAEYDKLVNENRNLLHSLVEGQQIEQQPVQEAPVDVNGLRKELYSGENNMTNLEYITKTLELRDAIMATGGQDPFLPFGEKIRVTQDDIEAANRVADSLKEMVEIADGDPVAFRNEFQRRVR